MVQGVEAVEKRKLKEKQDLGTRFGPTVSAKGISFAGLAVIGPVLGQSGLELSVNEAM